MMGVTTSMAKLGWLGTVWLTRLSRPATDRAVYRHVLQHTPRRILELGLGTLVRTERVLRLATRSAQGEIRYVGLDRFEGRDPSDPPGVSLKQAHRMLHPLGRVQLVPGNVDSSLARLCNQLGQFDLVLVSADNDERYLERSWFFIQRLVSAETTVLVETGASGPWQVLPRATLEKRAASAVLKRAS
jgi:hypothetical protein